MEQDSVEASRAKTYHLKWSSHIPNLETVFTTLLESESLSDVTLVCSDGTIKSHRLLLASCSNYFLVSGSFPGRLNKLLIECRFLSEGFSRNSDEETHDSGSRNYHWNHEVSPVVHLHGRSSCRGRGSRKSDLGSHHAANSRLGHNFRNWRKPRWKRGGYYQLPNLEQIERSIIWRRSDTFGKALSKEIWVPRGKSFFSSHTILFGLDDCRS